MNVSSRRFANAVVLSVVGRLDQDTCVDFTTDLMKCVDGAAAEEVAAGRSDAQIKAELRSRFGSGILLRPSSRGVSGLVWAIPVVVGVLALAVLAVAVQRWRSRTLHHASAADAVLVASAQGS